MPRLRIGEVAKITCRSRLRKGGASANVGGSGAELQKSGGGYRPPGKSEEQIRRRKCMSSITSRCISSGAAAARPGTPRWSQTPEEGVERTSFQPGGGGVEHSGGVNLAVAPFVLTLLGVYAIPALMVFLPMWLEDPRVRRAALAGAAVGLEAVVCVA